MSALLWLASHVESKATKEVTRQLVEVLDARNASAQMKSAFALAVLASRSPVNRTTIAAAGAIPALVRLLGDGMRTEADTPQERAAVVLADLARTSDSVLVIGRIRRALRIPRPWPLYS